MNTKIKILISLLFLVIGTITMSAASDSSVSSSELPSSSSYLETMNASLGGSDASVAVFSNKSISPFSVSNGWNAENLPGGDGWHEAGGFNVGGPIGDLSFPILLSMFFIYFLYRGVSSKKRRSL